jgi:hypothetical protein
MKLPNPQRNTWLQYNGGDFGDLSRSFNLNLSQKRGDIKISPRFMYTTNGNDDSDFQVPIAFKKVNQSSNNKWYIANPTTIFVGGTEPDDGFTQDVATGTPNLGSSSTPDMETFYSTVANGEALFAASNTLDRQDIDGADWDQMTVSGMASSGGAPMIKFAGRLYFKFDYRSMASINSAETAVVPNGTPNTAQYAFRMSDSEDAITCGRANSQYIWLGTRGTKGRNCRVVKWNGSSTLASSVYEIPAQAILSMTIGDNDFPRIIDNNLVIWEFNGGGFVKVARFPMKYNKRLASPNAVPTQWLVHYNGMMTDESGDILILANPKYADGTFEPQAPAGLWILNTENGLYHAGSMSIWDYGVTETATDYGQAILTGVGALVRADSYDATVDARYLAGASLTALSDKAAAFISNLLDDKQKAGHFVTAWEYSEELKDNFNKFISRFKNFASEGDEIHAKFRTKEVDALSISGTWASSSTFNTATDLRNYVGWEVEVKTGIGAGKSAHISTVTDNGVSGWLVTLDDTFTSASGALTAMVENFKRCGIYDGADDFREFSILTGASTKVQLKIFAIVTGDWFFHDLNLIRTKQQ